MDSREMWSCGCGAAQVPVGLLAPGSTVVCAKCHDGMAVAVRKADQRPASPGPRTPPDVSATAGFTPYGPVPRCDTCGWWRPFDADLQPATVGGIVPRLAEEFGADAIARLALARLGDCELFECRGYDQVHAESKLEMSRTQSGECTAVTQADFGCVQWKGRE